ncbi:MAG: SecY family transport protein, partial [Chloroflexota bacterium]
QFDPLGTIATIVTMTAGSMFAVWLGELITEQGVGNGVSIIIFGGIVAEMPGQVWRFIALEDYTNLAVFIVVTLVTLAVIVIITEGQRRIPVQYGKRVRGNKVYGGQSTHIPLKVNSAGMIPLIFAQSILIFPGSVAGFFAQSTNATVSAIAIFIVNNFSPVPEAWPYWITYFLMVVLFTFFYTDIIFKQQNLAENLQRQGGFIPGMRPGKTTEVYLTTVMRRITLVGAVFLGGVAILPWLVQLVPGVGDTSSGADLSGTLLVTSTGLLIVVGVVLDTMKQLEAQLMMRRYEGFIK